MFRLLDIKDAEIILKDRVRKKKQSIMVSNICDFQKGKNIKRKKKDN